jgi:CO/xanthine dehydrogenase FAD-binding subunit
MPDLKALYQPRTLAEAISLLEELGDRARPLAGGTTLCLTRSTRIEALVDLSRLGLDRIAEGNDGLHVGSMVTCAALVRHLRGRPPSALSDAAASVGSKILQNHVTVGGNAVMVYAWSDLPVALWCADATFVVQGQARRELSADRFFAEHPTHVLAAGEVLLEVVVPWPKPGTGSAYLKLGRNATDQALASVAARVVLEGGVVTAARIAAGAVRAMPQILGTAAMHLVGRAPEDAALLGAARQAAAEAKVTADYRASVDYRRELVSSLVEDALRSALARAGGAA